ncbi:MAG: hypothetical protein ABI680_05535 [Chthoniobacteraceae bacterium]
MPDPVMVADPLVPFRDRALDEKKKPFPFHEMPGESPVSSMLLPGDELSAAPMVDRLKKFRRLTWKSAPRSLVAV